MTAQPQRPAFGTVLTSHMAVAAYHGGRWSEAEIKPVAPIELSPAAHVLHYASTCFEGFKAFRRADGSIHIFRMDRHIQRMRQSARQLVLPEPDAAQLADMVRARDRALPRRRAGGAGCAVLAADSVRHHGEHRGGGDAGQRCTAAGAREPGLGLLRRRHEAAAHSGRRREHALARRRWAWSRPAAIMPRRWARRLQRTGEIPGRSGAVLSGRPGAGDRCRQLSADSRRRAVDARPGQHLSARRHARFATDARARSGLCRCRSACST